MIAAQESLSMAFDEIRACLDTHYEQLSLHRGRFPWVCNFAEYWRREADGELLVVVLRERGEAVGYYVGFVRPGLHYQTCLTLTMDVFWIKPEWRDIGMGALRLFRKVEQSARLRGVNLMMAGSKLHQDSSRLFKALGYAPAEQWHYKFLDY
jgi:hypothetical protein